MEEERPYYTTKYNTPFEKICEEVKWYCAHCTIPCETTKCLAYRIDNIISEREAQIRALNIDELFEKEDNNQLSLFNT